MTYEAAFNNRDDLQERYKNNALILFALEMRFDIEDIHAVAADSLTDGRDDKKIDLIYIDTDEKIAVIAQGYYSQNFNKEAPANKASDLNTGAGWLLCREIDELPERIKPSAIQLHDAIMTGDINRIEFWYVHNCLESANVESELKTVSKTASNSLKQLLENASKNTKSYPEIYTLEVGHIKLSKW
ncbi:MAG: hypothetical protein SAJ12_12415 [Jaaginema sp. PMC 1079.18]|nr:hypothetical protein [Jaaginema sp. PMC 1080.18]MEC4851810.1 hypothetical protein [Jaaginema sp. PMC 1079.18]MEC4868356.1 hypothetical protein [Jaaginema sp. PMC 1078.18]